MDKPIIGVTPDFATVPTQLGPTDRLFLNLDYALAVEAAGGIPHVLPPVLDPADALVAVEALLLTGGGDIDPHRYGAASVHPETYGISEVRDTFELALVKAAIARDLPVLAICRGIQVLNVALGGTLIQHIPASDPNALNHRQHELGIPVDQPAHPVTIMPESKLAAIVETTTLLVNSFHHQAIDAPAPGLVVTARAPDGVIEAVELPSATFVLGVQWHPERLYRTFPQHRALFRALVLAALRSRPLGRSARA
ncbi:MAG: gamma-glutamyl-gamma-aminobutyrate hydrolase family protein [Thermomicrobium sp.]|nr:gamma-glutamyl-gamma-aminobutyrate hydrolase family protein [Thermomicrobium sp.]MDW8058712.1 gamma-glutamyl-gamma-aminobutyrate hydrolase family protein [Thermomicrobium sp.]